IEQHWKLLKHKFLKLFVRPRLDLLIYIIIYHVFPYKRRKWVQHLNTRELPRWYSKFKQQWRHCYDEACSGNGILTTLERGERLYDTRRDNWTCGCSYYQQRPPKVCKHLVAGLEKAP